MQLTYILATQKTTPCLWLLNYVYVYCCFSHILEILGLSCFTKSKQMPVSSCCTDFTSSSRVIFFFQQVHHEKNVTMYINSFYICENAIYRSIGYNEIWLWRRQWWRMHLFSIRGTTAGLSQGSHRLSQQREIYHWTALFLQLSALD